MIVLGKAWNAVSNKTSTNCFKKASISVTEVERVLNDEDASFAGLDDIEEDSVQSFGVDPTFLKERFND